jgi:hypothetical protein
VEGFRKFDLDFARDARNVRIGLATDGFTPFGDNTTSYSCWPVFAIPYNHPHSLCMKYEFMFLCLIVPGPDHPGPKLNVMVRPLIDELKLMTLTRSKNAHIGLHICGRFTISWPMVFLPDGANKHTCNDMLLIATCRKLRLVLYLNPFTCITWGIRDQILKTLMPCVVRWQLINW